MGMKRTGAAYSSFFMVFALLTAAVPGRAAPMVSVTTPDAAVRGRPDIGAEVLWEAWIFTPLIVKKRLGAWLMVRDFQGYEGWIREYDTEKTPAVTIKTKKANVRSGPGADYSVEWEVDNGYTLRVVGRKGSWLLIEDNDGIEGWVHRSVTWGFVRPPERTGRTSDGSA